MARKNDTTAFPVEGGPGSGQWSDGMSLADYFAVHAHIDDVKMAEDWLLEAYTEAGLINEDPMKTRAKARYVIADMMLLVRGES